jgi:hypothetical protein
MSGHKGGIPSYQQHENIIREQWKALNRHEKIHAERIAQNRWFWFALGLTEFANIITALALIRHYMH